ETVIIANSEFKQGGAIRGLAARLAEQGQDDLAEPGEVLRGMAVPRPAVVLPEDYVEDPMTAVLDPPVQPNPTGQHLTGGPAAADVVGHLRALLLPLPAPPHDPHDRCQPLPVVLAAQPVGLVQHRVLPLLLPAMSLILTGVAVVPQSLEAGLFGVLEGSNDVGVQRRLVLLDRQQVIPTGV